MIRSQSGCQNGAELKSGYRALTLHSEFQTMLELTATIQLPGLPQNLPRTSVTIPNCLFVIDDRVTGRVRIDGTVVIKVDYTGSDTQYYSQIVELPFSKLQVIPKIITATALVAGGLRLEHLLSIPEIDPEELNMTALITHLLIAVTVRIVEPG